MKNIHAIVEGRVQGVGFRSFTQSTAIENNIVGWVKNLENGSVEIIAQGKEEEMEDFLAKIKKGPSMFAKVRNVKLEERKDFEVFNKFEIKY
ncbi:acylphosphatase [Gracilibacillus xinjiangensis]|uniref:Acylphosphatase n=1 Tax=Gracilibacillus xinjiangensis TaxID=1193282 RepID=A0ABV8WZL5_9BACI